MPKLIIFDLNGTLAESKQPITDKTAALLARLFALTHVAIASSGALSQLLKQVIAKLPIEADLSRLYLLPTSGAALYEYQDDAWQKIYEERLSEKDKDVIEAAMTDAIEETGIIELSAPSRGERIEYRESQVTLSALGQDAPMKERAAWDKDYAKQRALLAAITARLPHFSVSAGGAASIDVTRHGVDKAYGIRKLCGHLRIKEKDVLYVGDELRAGGNDEAVYKTEAQTKSVSSPTDTTKYIKGLLNA